LDSLRVVHDVERVHNSVSLTTEERTEEYIDLQEAFLRVSIEASIFMSGAESRKLRDAHNELIHYGRVTSKLIRQGEDPEVVSQGHGLAGSGIWDAEQVLLKSLHRLMPAEELGLRERARLFTGRIRNVRRQRARRKALKRASAPGT
jgi:hypothetical protein